MWFIPLQVGIPIWPPTYMWVGDTRPSVYPSSLRTHTYSAISTEESYCPSSLVLVECPLRRERSTIHPLGFAERILRDLSILFLSSAIRLSLNRKCHTCSHLHIRLHLLALAHTYTFGYTCSYLLTLTYLDHREQGYICRYIPRYLST